ncbi:MAG: amidohydrolase [Acidobacteria bacterium]|nr:MAG: amidohydrolase [Acidobacteriota bacterium]
MQPRRSFFSFALLIAVLMFATAPIDDIQAASKKKAVKDNSNGNGEEEEDKWDVDNPPGEHYEIEIDTDEGTWMSLDVSPDGEEIVFDLLGDLYTIPIGGGEAEALTSGFAWDMQPRYSPDGTSIAFTSDRGGGDNIWVMDRDGSDPRAVTEEDFRLLNSPVWSPDGNFIAARKHFTSRRSLGAGEIWLYHKSGGSGLQLNERPNDQKDLGEPAFSPDGRYVYFSRDSTPGDQFQYSKDSNDQIYTIHRIDRESGDIEAFISGAGGAVRPTPSPDGKWLAFVRRVRFQSTLFLHDMDTGANIPIYDNLERDMQETWAIHGVYPGIAWTPDSESIVFWAKGKIHRIDIASRDVTEILFHVKQTLKMTEALRFPVEVAPKRFDVHMLRWVQVAPAGNKVVYQALGHLYVRDLPDGEPRRLTGQDDHFEFYPSFSRDGKWIVYVTWHDESLGSVRVVSSAGGEGHKVTSRPGHYLEPVFSPDGQTIVYRKGSGGFVTSPLYSRDPGLYAISTMGGNAVRVTKSGSRPQFGVTSDRMFFTSREPEDGRSLKSIELDGSDERTHIKSEAATEFRLSPDGNWLAFSERYNAYIAPFVPAAQPVQLGPETKSIPVRKVSRDAGNHLHWSGDSKTLYWSLGAELYRRDLSEAFTFVDGAPEELPEPVAEGKPIGFFAALDVPTGAIVLTGARLITMRGEEVIENGTIVVEANRITAVGPATDVVIPDGAHVLDASGKTIIPGLVDVHWHGSQGASGFTPQQDWFNYASLAFGVTTAHDPSNDTSTFFASSELAKAGMITAPRLFSTGTILYGAAGDFKAIVNSLDDAKSHLRRLKAAGAFSVKSYNQPRRDQRQQLIAGARELEMMVVPEGGSLFQHNMTMVVDGHTGIEHSLPVAMVYSDVLQLWGASRTGYTPTLGVAYGGISGERYWYQHTNVWENERLMSFVPRFVVDPVARRRMMAPEEEYNHISNARVCKLLTDAGVKVNLGAHGQREGLAAHWEMWMFEQGGMTPMEALRAGTLNGAEYLGLDGDIGSIEVGKLADLAVLDKNPLENLRDSESVRWVMVNGRLYDAATMNQVGNHPAKRKPFFFEE